MRVSWNMERGLAALVATVVVLHGTGDQNTQGQVSAQTQSTRYPQTQYTAMAYRSPEGEIATTPTVATPTVEAEAPVQTQAGGYPNTANPGCNTCQSAPAASYGNNANNNSNGGYVARGYSAGFSGGYNTFNNDCEDGNCGYGRGGNLLDIQRKCGRRWFGGVYGLLMERDHADRIPLAFSTAAAPPYYPTDAEIVMTSRDADIGYQGGIEIRFGSTFGGGSGGYNCGPTHDWEHAWEAVYWGIFDESALGQVTDVTGGARLHGMIDFRGLEFDPGTGFRDVNVFYDYGPPTVDNTAPYDVEVRGLTVRNTLGVQNIEFNLLKMPVLCGGNGCGIPSSRYELHTLVGVRYMRFDEDFFYRSNFERMDTNALSSLSYNSEVDNQLVGFQIGSNGIYRLGRNGRLSMHCNTAVGVYGNSISVQQWMSPTVRYANGTLANFNVDSEKEDVAMIGELRLGASFQYRPDWKIHGAWRAIGVTGIALSTDQIPTSFNTPAQVGEISSNGSMILHGLQVGVEHTF